MKSNVQKVASEEEVPSAPFKAFTERVTNPLESLQPIEVPLSHKLCEALCTPLSDRKVIGTAGTASLDDDDCTKIGFDHPHGASKLFKADSPSSNWLRATFVVGPATHEISSSKVKRKRKNRKNNKFDKMVQFLDPCGIGPSECQYVVEDLMSVSSFTHLPCHFTLSCPCFFFAQGPSCCQWWGSLPHCNLSFPMAAKSD